MVKRRIKSLTRAKVIQIGFSILILGGFGYGSLRLIGFDGLPAGIAAEALLLFLILGWTASYLFRVVTGNMTFMEQRRRYRQAYEAMTDAELQAAFEGMSQEEKEQLMKEIDSENKSP